MKNFKFKLRKVRLKKLFKKQKDYFQLGVVALCVLCIVLSATTYYFYNKYSSTKRIFKTINQPRVGQLNDCDNAVMGVTSFKEDKVGIPGYWPAGDNKFLIIKMAYLNRTDEVYHLSPVLSAKVYDDTGKEYEVSSAPTIEKGLGGPVEPWASSVGEIGFSVPKDKNKFTFTFNNRLNPVCKINTDININ